MKKIIIIIVMLFSLKATNAQTNIDKLPAYTGNLTGAYVAIRINNKTYKIPVTSLASNAPVTSADNITGFVLSADSSSYIITTTTKKFTAPLPKVSIGATYPIEINKNYFGLNRNFLDSLLKL